MTIAVTPSEAERLVAAQYKGKLKIGLRGLNDASRFATTGASMNAIFGVAEQSTTIPGKRAFGAVSVKRRPRQGGLLPQSPGYGTLPPLTPTLQAEPIKIRVIKGAQVEEVEAGR